MFFYTNLTSVFSPLFVACTQHFNWEVVIISFITKPLFTLIIAYNRKANFFQNFWCSRASCNVNDINYKLTKISRLSNVV